MSFWDSLLMVIAYAILARPVETFFHEMGHAIAALLMSRAPVTIFVGSYGDMKSSKKFMLGRLTIWFKFSLRQAGYCESREDALSLAQKIIYRLAGPFASLLVASAGVLIALQASGTPTLIACGFFITGTLSFLASTKVNGKQIRLEDGKYCYNDMTQIVRLWKYRTFADEYEKAAGLYNEKKYRDAAERFSKLIDDGFDYREVYQITINSWLQAKDFEKAYGLLEELRETHTLQTATEFADSGMLKARFCQYEESLLDFQKAIELDPTNNRSRCDYAYTLLQLGRHAEAVAIFDEILSTSPGHPYTLANRGFARYQLGFHREGIDEILEALRKDEKEPYAYRNLGMIYLEEKNNAGALKHFYKAKEIDPSTHLIDQLISKTLQQN